MCCAGRYRLPTAGGRENSSSAELRRSEIVAGCGGAVERQRKLRSRAIAGARSWACLRTSLTSKATSNERKLKRPTSAASAHGSGRGDGASCFL